MNLAELIAQYRRIIGWDGLAAAERWLRSCGVSVAMRKYIKDRATNNFTPTSRN
jgi:hypothetical protein